ncbi:Similar to RFC1: Replication factor C subunit 1 (Homo sapiens) [Cotesia congregata]|uniref:Replication factor C subunit 1 n=1 Tax=Cotesia congregata TaxID=51543 RepID=A0A8J2MT06_COTCN|nr:Similar to RFC1: Replication factor C subunit 1 (Homo sapiens) [Cotesia congregata]
MSRDIRSYFSFPKGQSKNAPAAKPSKINKKTLSSDEEDSHASPKKNKAKKTKKTSNHIISDSDDEDTVTKKPVSKSPSTKGKDKVKEKEKELKPVTLDSIFSKEPVKRKNAPAPIPKKLKEAEASFHDDKEFEATLSQLDTTEIETIFQNKDKTKDKEKKLDQFSGKRKPSDSYNETSPKKIKLSEDLKVEKEKSKAKDKNANHSKLEVEVDKKKKQKNDADEVYEENIAKKKQHAVAYQQYLHRGGARNPGSKEIPKGAENCLAGLSFVVTGVLESLEREEVDELIKQYGGRVVGNLSKKTNYLVVGDAAGESKMAKADSLHVKKISEDELLEMIRSRPAGKSSAVIPSRSKKNSSFNKSTDDELKPSPPKKISSEVKPNKIEDVEMKSVNIKDENIFKAPISSKEASTSVTSSEKASTLITSSEKPSKFFESSEKASTSKQEFFGNNHVEALVEKYRPKMMKQIIGQHTDKSCARKLHTWILNWHKNQHGKVKPPKPSPWAKNDDGAFYKAALLSGAPGIGKTTTAQVVCNELGYDLVEFNASDTRSKRLLKEEVSTLLSNTSVKGYFSSNKEDKTSRKHVLLMDEVDGMAGNEDRGGLQELINLIKAADVPIICICNDRNHPKMRTLANYTFDLRFQKPRLEQIRGAMKSLCCKENISISTENLDRLIQSTNFDIRQVINHLAMLKGEPVEKKEGRISGDINKDLKLGPWDVVRKVFSAEEHKNMSIHDKSDLFFHDYNIAGLFVQENYLSVVPKVPKVAKTADSLSMGDLVEKAIREKNAWSLLPAQACYSSVIPGSLMSGHIGAQINFPSWLGRNSKRNKFDRILQEITVHTRLVTGASKEAINIDYLNALRDKITRPLALNGTEGVDSAVDVMNHYHLLREDLDGIVEVSLWPGQRDPFQVIDSKVRAAFTRSYNKNSTLTPFAATASKKKGGGDLTSEDSGYMEAGEETISDSDNDDDSLEADRMVKAKKAAPKKEPAKSTTKKTTSKASVDKPASRRGRGRGK